VVGHVTTTDATHSKFSLQNAVGMFSLTVDKYDHVPEFSHGHLYDAVYCMRAGESDSERGHQHPG